MGQSFGGFRPRIRWSQINTDTARIIFPDYLAPQAQRVSNVIHYLKRNEVDQIGDKAFKFDLLLNNQTTISNGFVSIAPWKSLFVTTPLQDSYQLTSLPWLDLLALHEYRHVIQLSSARRGIVNILYYLFGQESWAGAANLSLPGWFTEGDAVWAETTQSDQGRGRITSFLEGYRALKLSETKFRYDKVRNGSLKDFVPDHYRLGYLLVDYGYKNYGEQFWKEVMLDAAAYRGIFYPFARAMRQRSGMNPASMYNAMWDKLPPVTKAEIPSNPIKVPQAPSRRFRDFQYPHLPGDSTLVYFERSYDRIGTFHRLDLKTGEMETLATKGLSIDPYFGANGKFLTWTEYSTNARWVEYDYNDIVKFDLAKNRRTRITRNKQYFSPQPTRDGTKIICVSNTSDAKSTLVLIDGENGHVLREIQHSGWIYTYPQWTVEENSVITAVRDSTGDMGIIQIDLQSEDEKVIVPFQNRIIGIPEVDSSSVYYSASSPTVECIFRSAIDNGTTEKYPDEPNGAFQVTVGRDSIYYVTFTSMGHVIKAIDKASAQLVDAEIKDYEFEAQKNLLDSIPDNRFEVSRYHPLAKSINIHTWGLIVEDPEVVARVLSNNILNNIELSAGVRYNYDQQNYRPFAKASIAAWYPTLDLEVNQVNRSLFIEDALRKWKETNLFTGLSVNWNLFSGAYLRTLSPSIGINHSILTGDLDFSITSLATQLTFQQQKIKARKNIFTHSGQYLQMRYSTSIDEYLAKQYQIRSGLAVRGLGINHNLILEADLKSDIEDAEYQFSNGLNHRGYGVIPGQETIRLSVDYHFPILYPDRGIAGLVYFYRVRLNPFFEYSKVKGSDHSGTYQSVGAELVFDMNMVNEVPFSLGLRYSYPLETAFSPSYEIFIPVYRF